MPRATNLERANRARILALATDILSTKGNAVRWLQTPNIALNDQIPFNLLATEAGAFAVETILGRIAHGVYS